MARPTRKCHPPTPWRAAVPLKRCNHCHHTKPSEAFGKLAGAPDGLQYTCRECRSHAQRIDRLRNGFAIHNAEYEAMLDAHAFQDTACPVCGYDLRFDVDWLGRLLERCPCGLAFVHPVQPCLAHRTYDALPL